jgi:hypothetical protein
MSEEVRDVWQGCGCETCRLRGEVLKKVHDALYAIKEEILSKDDGSHQGYGSFVRDIPGVLQCMMDITVHFVNASDVEASDRAVAVATSMIRKLHRVADVAIINRALIGALSTVGLPMMRIVGIERVQEEDSDEDDENGGGFPPFGGGNHNVH